MTLKCKTEKKNQKHAKYSPSAAKRWLNCYGCIKLCSKIKPQKPTKYTVEGVVAHDLAEQVLRGKVKNPKTKIGDTVEKDGFIIEITEEMYDAIMIYVSTIASEMKKYGVSRENLHIEVKFKSDHISKDHGGTADAVLEIPFTKIITYDFKYGAGTPVEVEKNEQQSCYASGAYHVLDCDCHEVEFVIVQPRYDHSDGPVRRWETDVDYLREFEARVIEAIKESSKKNAPLSPGYWCKQAFCPARAQCPALKEQAKRIAEADFTPVVNFDPKAPAACNATELSFLMSMADLLTNYLKEIKKHAQQLASQGMVIPGYKLVKHFGDRKIADKFLVTEKFEPKFGEKIFRPKELKTLTDLEKIIGKKDFADYVVKPDKGSKLVSVHQKGEEIKIDAASDFSGTDDL